MSEEQLHKTIIDYLSSYKPERIRKSIQKDLRVIYEA